jgi:hypothetical protein
VPGELWREIWQVGREATSGTPVAATRKVYLNNTSLTRSRDNRPHSFATGTRDNVRAFTLGPVAAGGSVSMDVSADEMLEWLLITIQGAVTPTTPAGATNARLWTFKPANTVDSMTIERNDGANLMRGLGYRGNTMTVAGSVGGANTATFDLFGQDVTMNWGGPLASLTDRAPTFMEGWQTRLWLDPFGNAPGGTYIPNAMINWNVTFNGNLGRKYTAANTLGASATTLGTLDITANLMLEASAAQSITELANWDATSKRTIMLEFIETIGSIEAGANEVQTITVTGTPTGGSFTVNAFGTTVGPIAFNSTAAAAQPLFDAAFGAGTTVVTGGPLPGTPLTVTFGGTMAGYNWPQLSLGTNSLTGGATPTATFATTTPGRSGARFVQISLPGAWQTPDFNQSDAGTRSYAMPFQYVYDPTTLGAGIQVACQTARTTAF